MKRRTFAAGMATMHRRYVHSCTPAGAGEPRLFRRSDGKDWATHIGGQFARSRALQPNSSEARWMSSWWPRWRSKRPDAPALPPGLPSAPRRGAPRRTA